MKKRSPIILLLILGLILVLVYFNTRPSAQNSEHSSSGSESPHSSQSGNHKPEQTEHSKAPAQADSPTPKAYSSSVNVNIKAGETLVMGGYRREDGKHEFTMLTPTLVRLMDGSPGIIIKSRAMAMDLGLAHKRGLNSLTTHYPTADDHAEAWTQEEVRSTMLSASKAEGIELMAAPSVTNALGQAFSLNVGGANGMSAYSIEATVSHNTEGEFSVQSRTERNSGSQYESSEQ